MKVKRKKSLAVLIFIVLAGIVVSGVSYGVPLYKEYREKKAEEKRRSQEPYFTEFHLPYIYMLGLNEYYGVKITPVNYYFLDPDDGEWPDYSYYTMEATERTERVAMVLSYQMFVVPQKEEDERAAKLASEYGLSGENPMTADWVMEHPAEAVEILGIVNVEDKYHRNYSMVDDVYNEIMGSQEEEEAGCEE